MSIPEGYHMDKDGLIVKDRISVFDRFKKRVDAVEVSRPPSLDVPPLTNDELKDAYDRQHEIDEKEKRYLTDRIELEGAGRGIIPESIKTHWKLIAGVSALIGILAKIAGCF
jgi:hypothetical protein